MELSLGLIVPKWPPCHPSQSLHPESPQVNSQLHCWFIQEKEKKPQKNPNLELVGLPSHSGIPRLRLPDAEAAGGPDPLN